MWASVQKNQSQTDSIKPSDSDILAIYAMTVIHITGMYNSICTIIFAFIVYNLALLMSLLLIII